MQRATSEKALKPSSLHIIQSHQAEASLPSLRELARPAAANPRKNSEKSISEDMRAEAMQIDSAEQQQDIAYSRTRAKLPSARTSQKKAAASAPQQSSIVLQVQTVEPPPAASTSLLPPEKTAGRKRQVASAEDDAVAELRESVSSILKVYAPSPPVATYGRWHDHVPSSSYLLYIWDKKAAKTTPSPTVATTQLQSQPQQAAPESAARRKECVCMESAYGSKELPGTGPNGHFFSVGSVQVRDGGRCSAVPLDLSNLCIPSVCLKIRALTCMQCRPCMSRAEFSAQSVNMEHAWAHPSHASRVASPQQADMIFAG
jgi:hypothetical protein